MWVMVAVELGSASVSLSVISPVWFPVLDPAFAEALLATVKVPPSLIKPLSTTPTGSSFTPTTVIIKVAVSVPPFPSETV